MAKHASDRTGGDTVTRITLPHSHVGGVQTGAWGWVAGAGVLGAATSAVVTGVLDWSRDRFVAVHAAGVLALALWYVRWSGIGVGTQLQRRWKAGLAGGLIVGGLLAQRVLALPGARGSEDPALAAHLVWLGLVYGLADAVLLSVLPVLAVYGSESAERMRRAGYRLRAGGRALLASLLVTAMYHLGFPEFRGRALVQPLIGNGVMTAGYLLTGNPLTPTIAHVLLHGAAVLRGPETTVQLPPHRAGAEGR
jgi:hypothetical protein